MRPHKKMKNPPNGMVMIIIGNNPTKAKIKNR